MSAALLPSVLLCASRVTYLWPNRHATRNLTLGKHSRFLSAPLSPQRASSASSPSGFSLLISKALPSFLPPKTELDERNERRYHEKTPMVDIPGNTMFKRSILPCGPAADHRRRSVQAIKETEEHAHAAQVAPLRRTCRPARTAPSVFPPALKKKADKNPARIMLMHSQSSPVSSYPPNTLSASPENQGQPNTTPRKHLRQDNEVTT